MDDIETLLREYVRSVVEIRSKKDVHSIDKQRYGKRFDLKTFMNLTGRGKMMDYAETFLDEVGTGSSRRVFVLSSRYVLKIAKNAAGLGQNSEEVSISSNPKIKELVARVHRADDNNVWVISDLVRPVKNEAELIQKLRVRDLNTFKFFMQDVFDAQEIDNPPSKEAAIVAAAMLENDLMPGDLVRVSTWGITADGRLVMLDYGFTPSVNTRYYVHRYDKDFKTFDTHRPKISSISDLDHNPQPLNMTSSFLVDDDW